MGRPLIVPRPLLREAFDLVLAKWPETVVPGAKTFHLGGGCNMRALNEAHGAVENWVAATGFKPDLEPIISSVEFYVFQSIHSALRDLTHLRKEDLDFEAFVSRFDGHPDFKVVA